MAPTAGVPSNAIEDGLAHLQNYKGVYSDNAYITGIIDEEDPMTTAYNKHKNAGLISKEHFTKTDGYFYDTEVDYEWLTGLKGNSSATADEIWDSVFGKATRPLLIWNDGSRDGKAYGYIGSKQTIAANTYTTISVNVKVSAGATANVYLIDADSNYDTTLSIGRNLTFWYDNNGNVCNGDPSEKATQVAFKLQTNGLYIVNKTWDGYDPSMDGKYFANLNAYEKHPISGDMLVAEGGASHEYNTNWDNEGQDGIAFYYNESNSTYYADRAKTIPVSNLADVQTLKPRYTAINAETQGETQRELMATVEYTNEQWQRVTFYIHTGESAKKYRLEVWSGDRNTGAGNPDGTYVLFDFDGTSATEAEFPELLKEFEEKTTDKFEGVFSYFDTAMYLRYNASLDENKYGNLYEDNYTPTAQTEGIAYLRYASEDAIEIFADYQYSEKSVTASTPDTDDDTDDDDETTTDSETNIWLLASSLAIAIILVFVVISIVVRKVVAKVRKNRAMQASMKSNKNSK